MKTLLKESALKNCRGFCDSTVKWLMHSLYLGHPVSGPYDDVFSQKLCENHARRPLYKQVFQGEYGPAGIVYSIEGSPPRGVVVVMDDSVVFYGIFQGYKPKIIMKNEVGGRRQDSFKRFVAQFFLECWLYEKSQLSKHAINYLMPPGMTCQPGELVNPG